MFKKLVAIASATAMTVAMAVSAFAAGAISTDEQKVLDALTAAGVPAAQVEQVKAEFLKEGVDISATQATNAIASIDDAKKIVADAGITTIDELKANTAVLDKVVAKANEAAKEVGYEGTISVSVDPTTGKATSLTGGTGIAVVKDNSAASTTSSSIKSTGVDFSTTATVVAGLGLSVAGVAIASSKKRVSANA